MTGRPCDKATLSKGALVAKGDFGFLQKICIPHNTLDDGNLKFHETHPESPEPLPQSGSGAVGEGPAPLLPGASQEDRL